MTETQESMGEWARSTFPGGDDLSPRHCLRLLEEVIELCQAAGASTNDIDAIFYRSATDESTDSSKVPAELADCAIVLAVLAERRGVDLQAEVDRKMAINRARQWKLNGDGTGYHLKDGEEIPENKGNCD